jgi:hypothetical protein
MRENVIETYLRKRVQALGGKAYKWSSPGNRGVPDRLCFFPGAKAYIVECKAPGKKPTPLQAKVIHDLRQRGFIVLVLDSKELVDMFIQMVEGDMKNGRSSVSEQQ